MTKTIVIILLGISFLFPSTQTHCQASIADKQRILTTLRALSNVESDCPVLCNCFEPSEIYMHKDSLFKRMTLQEIVSYCKDFSYIIRTYAFTDLLIKNDSIAYEFLLQHICDSTRISVDYEVMAFNSFMLMKYKTLLKTKYYQGGGGTFRLLGRMTFRYGPPNKKFYKQRLKELDNFFMHKDCNKQKNQCNEEKQKEAPQIIS